jgi:hypothetical protein
VVRIIMLKSYSYYKKGETYNMSVARAKALVRAGVARKEYK